MRRTILVAAGLTVAAFAYAQTSTAPAAKPADPGPVTMNAPATPASVRWEYKGRILFNYTPDEIKYIRRGQRDHVSQAPVMFVEEDRAGWELVTSYTLKGIFPINPKSPETSVERVVYIFRRPTPTKK